MVRLVWLGKVSDICLLVCGCYGDVKVIEYGIVIDDCLLVGMVGGWYCLVVVDE